MTYQGERQSLRIFDPQTNRSVLLTGGQDRPDVIGTKGPVGSQYLRFNGSLYMKDGVGNTDWVACCGPDAPPSGGGGKKYATVTIGNTAAGDLPAEHDGMDGGGIVAAFLSPAVETIVIMAGTYIVPAVTRPGGVGNIRMVGMGKGNTIITVVGGGFSVGGGIGAKNFTVEHLTLIGTGTPMVAAIDVSDILIQHCELLNIGPCISAVAFTGPATGFRILNNDFSGGEDAGTGIINLDAAAAPGISYNDILIEGNRFVEMHGSAIQFGFVVGGLVENIVINKNFFADGKEQNNLIVGRLGENINISNNVVNAPSQETQFLYLTECNRFEVIGNTLEGFIQQFAILDQCNNAVVSNNVVTTVTITDPSDAPSIFFGSESAFIHWHCGSSIFSDNRFFKDFGFSGGVWTGPAANNDFHNLIEVLRTSNRFVNNRFSGWLRIFNISASFNRIEHTMVGGIIDIFADVQNANDIRIHGCRMQIMNAGNAALLPPPMPGSEILVGIRGIDADDLSVQECYIWGFSSEGSGIQIDGGGGANARIMQNEILFFASGIEFGSTTFGLGGVERGHVEGNTFAACDVGIHELLTANLMSYVGNMFNSCGAGIMQSGRGTLIATNQFFRDGFGIISSGVTQGTHISENIFIELEVGIRLINTFGPLSDMFITSNSFVDMGLDSVEFFGPLGPVRITETGNHVSLFLPGGAPDIKGGNHAGLLGVAGIASVIWKKGLSDSAGSTSTYYVEASISGKDSAGGAFIQKIASAVEVSGGVITSVSPPIPITPPVASGVLAGTTASFISAGNVLSLRVTPGGGVSSDWTTAVDWKQV